jgi:diaminopimelate decarboxylase
MTPFSYTAGELRAEAVPLSRIAQEFGTPCYVYSRAALMEAWRSFDAAFEGQDHLVCYAVKANSNIAILDLFAQLGSGFDVVSGGELARVRAAGGDPGKVVFSGVGKSAQEIRDALAAGILCFNVESASELLRLDRIAGELGVPAPVGLRVNPDVDAGTHPYIATGLKQDKFGVAHGEALALYRQARDLKHLRIKGIGCHIGSQVTATAPFTAALEKIVALADQLEGEGIALSHLDIGGGLAIRYRDETPPSVTAYAQALRAVLGKRRYRLMLEPGRLLVGNAGLLLTRVEYLKQGEEKNFAVVDAAMNDLVRPSLYDAWHGVMPVREGDGGSVYDVVGPICESGDFLARDRRLPVNEGDLLALMSAGAYGMSMASNYNTRPRAAEIMVDGSTAHVIREREDFAELMAREKLLPR